MGENIENIIERYDRQELIEGWNQNKLEKSNVAVIGSNILANYATITLAALGFGNIEVYGNGIITNETKSQYSQGFLYSESRNGKEKTEAIANFAKKINPLVEVNNININFNTEKNVNVIGTPDIIIETTNNPASKVSVINYAKNKQIPVISISSNENTAKLGIYNPKRSMRAQKKLIENIFFTEFQNEKQGSTTSQVIAGLAVEEARKYMMPIKSEKIIEDVIIYNLLSKERFDNNKNINVQGSNRFKEKTVLLVGAGALGNFVGLDLVLNEVENLIIVDDDVVSPTNLNRQIFFYNSVNQPKTPSLIKELKKINPKVKYESLIERVGKNFEQFLKERKIDLIIDSVDNNKTRALLNYFSLKHKIPLISGGTRHNSGQVVTSKQDQTACLNCQVNIDKLALESLTPQSCIHAAQPSVITSNQIIGGMIVGEARTILNPQKYGQPIQAVIKYISDEEFRVGILPSQQKCNCHKNKKLIKNWMKKMKPLYKEEKQNE